MTGDQIPLRVGLLPDSTASRALTESVLKGHEALPTRALEKAARPPFDDSTRWEVGPLRFLFEETMRRYPRRNRAQGDAWLAPRLHATLRLRRTEAADSGLWNFLSLCVAPDFVGYRWGEQTKDTDAAVVVAARFSGLWHTQCFSRLWWTAETFRDGPDYSPAVTASGIQDVVHNPLRMDIFRHRPTAQVLVHLMRKDVVRTGREMNALAAAVNAAGGTLLLERLAPDGPRDPGALRDWIDEHERAPEVPLDQLPEGPDDGRVPKKAVEALAPDIERIFAEAPVRGREPKEASTSEGFVDDSGDGP